jgi:hypothetical protein
VLSRKHPGSLSSRDSISRVLGVFTQPLYLFEFCLNIYNHIRRKRKKAPNRSPSNALSYSCSLQVALGCGETSVWDFSVFASHITQVQRCCPGKGTEDGANAKVFPSLHSAQISQEWCCLWRMLALWTDLWFQCRFSRTVSILLKTGGLM